jgi:hypothetical protein
MGLRPCFKEQSQAEGCLQRIERSFGQIFMDDQQAAGPQ